MPGTDIASAEASEIVAQKVDYSVPTEVTDGPTGEEEFTWMMEDWAENLGYYKNIPELQTAVDAKALWTMGAGFEADEETQLLLLTIKGNGKDSFNSILRNQIIVKTVGGDSFAEIIRDKNEILVNLKPLDPSTIREVFNRKGIILRYEQVTKILADGTRNVIRTFQPDEIFHLSRNRIADEVHGISIIPAVKWIINARNEAMSDWKKVLHLNIKPFIIWHLDTDDTVEIAAFKAKNDKASADGENIYIPKGVVVPEVITPLQNNATNPSVWINQLNDYFFQVVNTPQIIVGNAKEFTDASGKIVYLAYEQSVKGEQLYAEEQVLNQLNLEIKLTFPASLQIDAVSDTPTETDQVEEEPIEDAAQPNDVGEEMEGKK